MSRNLIRLIDRALRHRPALFDEAGSIYLKKHGYFEKDTPAWYTDRLSDKDRCMAAPFLVWLWDWVRPVLMELAATPKDIRILLAKLPRPVAIPKLVQGKRGYTADTQARRKFHARFDVPPVHLWVLWQQWREIAAGSQKLPDAPPYPGAVCPTGAQQGHCRWKPIPNEPEDTDDKDVCKVLEECPRLFEESLAADPLHPYRLSFEVRHGVDLLHDALGWLRRISQDRTGARTVQAVMAELLELYQRGEPYTSERDLATRLRCATGTVRKAISHSKELLKWRGSPKDRTPRAQSLNARVTDTTPSAAPDPADVLPDDEVDKVIARLIQEAPKEKRAELNALNQDQRRKMARLVLDQEVDRGNEEYPRGNRLLGRKP